MARVLVVEDDTHIRDLIVLHLGLEGLETEAVGDGMQGLALASAHAFDLILLDLMLPGMDGVSICRSIRREGPNQDVPLLMLTARREESDKALTTTWRSRLASVNWSRAYARCCGDRAGRNCKPRPPARTRSRWTCMACTSIPPAGAFVSAAKRWT